MATFVECKCGKEFLTSEGIAYNLPDGVEVVCIDCRPPQDKPFIVLDRVWVHNVSNAAILTHMDIPKNQYEHGTLVHDIMCPYFDNDYDEWINDDACDCEMYEYVCNTCATTFEVAYEDQLLFPNCPKCVDAQSEVRKYHPVLFEETHDTI